MVTRLAGVGAGGQVVVPIDDRYDVTASTVLDGNTYTTAPIAFEGASGFLAQILQDASQDSYEFKLVQTPSTAPDQLQFQKTCISPVTFNLSRNGKLLQSIVVSNSFEMKTLERGDTFNVFAVINGVTTATLVTSDQEATIRAVDENLQGESNVFSLVSL